MDIIHMPHIETLHPKQIQMLEDLLSQADTPSDILKETIARIVHILLKGKGSRIGQFQGQGMEVQELRRIFGNNPQLERLLASMNQTIETTKRILKEKDFEHALRLLEEERSKGFLPNIVTFKRLIIKTGGNVEKLRRVETILLSEGVSKSKHYDFYANLIGSGKYNPRRGKNAGGNHGYLHQYQSPGIRLEENPKYREAIQAGLSHDLARALAQGLLDKKF